MKIKEYLNRNLSLYAVIDPPTITIKPVNKHDGHALIQIKMDFSCE